MMYCLNSKQLCFHFVSPLPNLSLGSSLSWFWKNAFDNEFRTYTKHKIHLKASSVKYHISFFVARIFRSTCINFTEKLWCCLSMCLSEWNDFQDFVILKRHWVRLPFIPFLLHWNVRHSKVEQKKGIIQILIGSQQVLWNVEKDHFLLTFSFILIPLSFHALSFAWIKPESTALVWNRQKVYKSPSTALH